MRVETFSLQDRETEHELCLPSATWDSRTSGDDAAQYTRVANEYVYVRSTLVKLKQRALRVRSVRAAAQIVLCNLSKPVKREGTSLLVPSERCEKYCPRYSKYVCHRLKSKDGKSVSPPIQFRQPLSLSLSLSLACLLMYARPSCMHAANQAMIAGKTV